MPGRRRYTKAEKAEAVGKALVDGQEATSEQLGIPKATLHYWVHHPEFEQLRTKTRDGVADMFWAAVQIGVDQVAIGLLDPEAPLRDKATALGILYDKHALLTGSATSRSESRDITGTVSDNELIAAVREAEHLAGAGRTPAPVEGAPEG